MAFPWAASSKILYNIAQCLTETLFLVPVMRVMDGFGRNLTEQGRRQKQIRKILEFNPINLCNFTAWIFSFFLTISLSITKWVPALRSSVRWESREGNSLTRRIYVLLENFRLWIQRTLYKLHFFLLTFIYKNFEQLLKKKSRKYCYTLKCWSLQIQ